MNRIISNFVCNHCHLGIAQTSLALHSAKSFILITVFTVLTFNIMAQQKIVQTAGRTQLVSLPRSSPTSTTTSSLEKYGAAMTCFHCATAVW